MTISSLAHRATGALLAVALLAGTTVGAAEAQVNPVAKLTASLSADTPKAGLAIAGIKKLAVYTAKLTASNSDVLIKKFAFDEAGKGKNDKNVSVVSAGYDIKNTDGSGGGGGSSGTLFNGIVIFDVSGMPLKLKKGGSMDLKLYVDVTDPATAVSNSKLQFVLSPKNFEVIDTVSSSKISLTTSGNLKGSTFTVARSAVLPSLSPVTPSGSKTTSKKDVVLAVGLANPSSYAAALSKLSFSLSGSFIAKKAGDNKVALSVYDNADLSSASLLGTVTLTGVEAGKTTTVSLTKKVSANATGNVTLPANTSKTVYVVLDTTDSDFVITSGDDTLTAALTGYAWADNDALGKFDVTQNNQFGITLPITGTTLRY